MAMNVANDPDWFSHNASISVEGWRTAILTCRVCGATITLSRTDDTAQMHRDYHEAKGERP